MVHGLIFFFLFVSINNACFAQDDRDLDWIKKAIDARARVHTNTKSQRDVRTLNYTHTRTNTTHGNKLSVSVLEGNKLVIVSIFASVDVSA